MNKRFEDTFPKKVVQLKLSNFIISVITSLLLIGSYWGLFIGITYAGCPFPAVNIQKFFDLGFFCFSTFSFIIFLTMIPFQRAEEKLSPGFYSRVIRTPGANFGLYVLMISSIICFAIIDFQQQHTGDFYIDQLFFALTASIISAILFHRFWVLRHLYHPYVVYNNVLKLAEEEGLPHVWEELLECTYKTIGERRLGDSKQFLFLLSLLYPEVKQEQDKVQLHEDLKSVYESARTLKPIVRYMEKEWPFLNRSGTEIKLPTIPINKKNQMHLEQAELASSAAFS